MRTELARVLLIVAASLWLAGCNTTDSSPRPFGMSSGTAQVPGANAQASAPPGETTGSVTPRDGQVGDDLIVLGKQEYRANNFDRAAKHFSRAAERNPRSAEAWLGLAASYDRLHQFELADSAYEQAIVIEGQTAEILNNQGYSYLLRGDLARARAKLTAAKAKEPGNKYVQNNLALLADAQSKKKTAQ
jgi:Flp pilus assembly protein TadD